MTTLVDLYLRLSDGRDLSSLKARERKLRREAERRGWTVHRVVIENDMTPGGKRNASAFKRRKVVRADGTVTWRVVRIGFETILDDFRTGRANAIYAEDLDRVCRDPRDGEDLLEVAEAYRITADSLSGSLKLTDGGTDNEIYAFRSTVNHANKSSKDTARRVREARERQADEGIWGGGPRPYGFTPVPHPDGKYRNTQLEWNDHEVKIIQDMADRVLSGQSLRSIARDLRESGEPTVTDTWWTPEMVKDILLRRLNMARMTYRGEDIGPAPFEPLFTQDQWTRLNAWLTSPDRNSKRGPAANRLLSGIAHCPCGQTLEAGPRETYACKALRSGPGGGGHVRRRYVELDAYISRMVVEHLSDADAFHLHTARKRPDIDVQALTSEAREIRNQLHDLGVDYAERLVTREVMRAGSARLQAKLDAIESQLSEGISVSAVSRLVSPVNSTNVVHLADTAVRWEKLSLGERRAIVKEVATVTVLPLVDAVRREVHVHYDKVVEAYLNGATVKQAATKCGVPYRKARERIVAAGVALRTVHTFNPGAITIEWN